jgi:hypothetical protein
MQVLEVEDVDVQGCVFSGCYQGIKTTLDGSHTVKGLRIKDCTFTGCNHGLLLFNIPTFVDCFLEDNYMSGVAWSPLFVYWDTVLPDGWTIRNNTGLVTENSGAATINNGSTSVVVAHGIGEGANVDMLPDASKIQVTPVSALGDASYWWVHSADSTHFTIEMNAVHGSADVSFNWSIVE